MARQSPRIRFRARGPFACFTRPEFKVERVSYDVITPTAAQGLAEAILWKPEFAFTIEQIEVLTPIRYLSVRRNEVKTGFPMRSGDLPTLDITTQRVQRNSMILRDVDYIIEASLALTQKGIAGRQEITKYVEMFSRRVKLGQHFRVPVFGCREFAADVIADDGHTIPIAEDRVFGMMPLVNAWTTGGPQAAFFAARMIQGVIRIRDMQS
jgi:CRISPR-associated protein Cas5d